jgi:hypothetical protein
VLRHMHSFFSTFLKCYQMPAPTAAHCIYVVMCSCHLLLPSTLILSKRELSRRRVRQWASSSSSENEQTFGVGALQTWMDREGKKSACTKSRWLSLTSLSLSLFIRTDSSLSISLSLSLSFSLSLALFLALSHSLSLSLSLVRAQGCQIVSTHCARGGVSKLKVW